MTLSNNISIAGNPPPIPPTLIIIINQVRESLGQPSRDRNLNRHNSQSIPSSVSSGAVSLD